MSNNLKGTLNAFYNCILCVALAYAYADTASSRKTGNDISREAFDVALFVRTATCCSYRDLHISTSFLF